MHFNLSAEQDMLREGLSKFLAARFHFEPGQIQLIDNRALGHNRTGFRDWPEPDRKRLLVRLWLRDSGSRAYNG